MRLPVRALAIGSLFSVVFAYMAIVSCNREGPILPSTQISSIGILFCLLLVLLVNPLLKCLRCRVLTRREVILVLVMATVPAGIPVFGFICEVLSLAGGLHHPEWNTPQSQWNERVVPYVDPDLFIGAPLFHERDVRNWRAFHAELQRAGEADQPGPARRLWDMLPHEIRERVRQAADGKDFTPEEYEEALEVRRRRKRARMPLAGHDVELAAWEMSLTQEELRATNRYALVRALAKALESREFYRAEDFQAVRIPPEATELLKREQESLSGEEIERLNRHLLEAGLAEHILPSKFLKDQRAIRDYVRGMQARNQEAWPVFVKKPEETWKQFASRFARYCNRKPELEGRDIVKWWAFYDRLFRSGKPGASRAQAHVWQQLPPNVQSIIQEIGQGVARITQRELNASTSLTEGLRALFAQRDLLQEDDLQGLSLDEEVRDLLARGRDNLGEHGLQRLHRGVLTAMLGREVLDDWRRFSVVLVGRESQPPLVQRVWERLSPEIRETVTLAAAVTQQAETQKNAVLEGLNALIRDRAFYVPESFAELPLRQEAKTLLSERSGALPPEAARTLNRLLLEATFPRDLRTIAIRLAGGVPWSRWVTPLLNWGLIALVFFMLFYALNELVFRQWYEREKIVFPIAQLSASVLESKAEEGGSLLPVVFKTPLFWIGFAIAFGIYFYNGMVRAHWIEGLQHIEIRGNMTGYLRGTVLEGMIPFRFEIFFTVVGLTFLLPAEVSFSLWFFFLFMVLQRLVAVWLGYGVDGYSFRADWYTGANFMSAQGGGAIHVFGLIYLWRVRHQLLAFVYRLIRPDGTASVSREDIERHWWPSLLFFLATAGIFYLMLQGGVSLGMAALVYVILLIFAVGLVRLVAECGLVSFQIMFGPFHVMNIFGLLKFPLLFAARGLGTVMLIISGLFLDMKTFIAPTMMNAKFLAVRNKVENRSFALGVFVAILLTLTVSAAVWLMLAYDLGVGSMHDYFSRTFPQWTFNSIAGMTNDLEGMATVDGDMAAWFCIGAVQCGILLYLRQFLFWIPHPIGLIMFSNSLIVNYSFSFFLAWVFKRAAVKYCNEDQYLVIRAFFIGLILGAVVAVGASTVLSLFFDLDISISLNPHSAR